VSALLFLFVMLVGPCLWLALVAILPEPGSFRHRRKAPGRW
jgi:hypothetical protein